MSKFYAVLAGREPGIYTTWDECKLQVDGVPNHYKAFKTVVEALNFLKTPTPKYQKLNNRQISSIIDKLGTAAPLHSFNPLKKEKIKTSTASEIETINIPKKFNDISPNLSTSTSKNTLKRTLEHEYIEKVSSFFEIDKAEQSIIVYTDGSCLNNGNPDAKAGLGVWFGHNHPMNLSERLPGIVQTNNRAEMLAAIRALETSPQQKILLFSDSQYLKNGLESWMENWKARGWKTAKNTDVLNKDLWMRLDYLTTKRLSDGVPVTFRHVYGHTGVVGNEEADLLANQGALKDF